MHIEHMDIPEVLLISPRKFGDERGFFSETFRQSALSEAGFNTPFVQDNHSLSELRGTVRGLHYQVAPHQQDKLIRVARGAILDVAVDLRPKSPHYGNYVAVELSAENWRQLLVPRGFAHGFQTLSDNTEVLYKVTDYYSPEKEGGVLWCDPSIGIDWPISRDNSVVNARDAAWPTIAELTNNF